MDADPVAILRAELERHPVDRQPLQHATAQFHLGGVLLGRDELDGAEASFAAAAALFGARGARPEQAKALNGLGATLRAAGRLPLAAQALEHAVAGLAAAGLALEEGAARFNLGLVLRESGHPDTAATVLERAVALLAPAQAPAQAAAATRELGATRLELGDLDGAEAALEDAVALADRAGDQAARGSAANALGLARLASGRAAEAMATFETAAAANPRGVRPAAFAMAKANLALACERTGAAARARLAARQALAAPDVPVTVAAQATAVLDRLRSGGSDLRAVLEEETPEGRDRLVREELARSAGAGETERAADAHAWLEAHTASALEPAEVAELWLGGLLELPPDALEELVRTTLTAAASLDPEARDSFRQAVSRGMARFHIPQWMRLQDVFSRVATDLGDTESWR